MPVLRLHDLHKIKRWDGFDINRVNKVWNQLDDIGRFVLDMKVKLGNKDGNFKGIKGAWQGKPCFIVGASANLKGFDLNKLDGHRSIGINHMIEYYDKFTWFIFLDNRFLKRTTYNIDAFKGKIFTSNRCMILPNHLNWFRFKAKPFNSMVDLNIEKGLFNGALTGLCALNLALISGANPIYMLGMDHLSESCPKTYHYDDNYTGLVKTKEKLNKYVGSLRYFERFSKFKDRIINVGEGIMPYFNRISLEEFEKRLENMPKAIKAKKEVDPQEEVKKIQVSNRLPIICHMITMPHMNQMGDISRQVYNMTYGKHIFCNINNQPPKADLYLLECFINKWDKYVNFQKPANSKVISLIHSSGRCMPAKCSDATIALTYGWQKVLKRKGIDSYVIPAGIDTKIYNKKINYDNKNFGRITRWSQGKVHPNWNNIMKNILTVYPDSKSFIISNNARRIDHKRAIYVTDIKINEHQKKVDALSNFCVFADMHNTFQETFSLCLLEHMASGHACILYSTAPQPAMWEILGDCGILCNSEQDFKNKLVKLLADTAMKKEYGQKAKAKAQMYSIERMINSYNNLFKNILGEIK